MKTKLQLEHSITKATVRSPPIFSHRRVWIPSLGPPVTLTKVGQEKGSKITLRRQGRGLRSLKSRNSIVAHKVMFLRYSKLPSISLMNSWEGGKRPTKRVTNLTKPLIKKYQVRPAMRHMMPKNYRIRTKYCYSYKVRTGNYDTNLIAHCHLLPYLLSQIPPCPWPAL
jgi:hypothetical protein